MKKTNDVCEVVCVNTRAVGRAKKHMPAPDQVARVAETFAALGDPTRVRILAALATTELCVCDLAALLGMTLSAVSHQLRLLRHLGLVKYRKEGRLAHYALDDEHASEMLSQMLKHIEHQPGKAVR
jgi:DNA-binding transcriptional ArsR family regulator